MYICIRYLSQLLTEERSFWSQLSWMLSWINSKTDFCLSFSQTIHDLYTQIHEWVQLDPAAPFFSFQRRSLYSCFVYKIIKLRGYFLQFYYMICKNKGCPVVSKGSTSNMLKDSAVAIATYYIFVRRSHKICHVWSNPIWFKDSKRQRNSPEHTEPLKVFWAVKTVFNCLIEFKATMRKFSLR